MQNPFKTQTPEARVPLIVKQLEVAVSGLDLTILLANEELSTNKEKVFDLSARQAVLRNLIDTTIGQRRGIAALLGAN